MPMSRVAAITWSACALVVAGLVALVVVPVATAGPLPAITPRDPLNEALADQVELAQDDLWPYRDAIVQDVEATIQEVGFIGDARAALAGSAAEPVSGRYTLLDASTTPDSTRATLALTATSATGGGWWYSQRTVQDADGVCVDEA